MKRREFDRKKHLRENYLSDNKAIIKVLIENKSDFFNKFDPSMITLSNDVANYIVNKAYNVPFRYGIVVNFYADDLSEKEKEHIRRITKEYFAMEILNKESVIKTNVVKSLCLLLLGALMVIYSFVGKSFYGYIYEEVVYVIGWVLLWEGIDILLLSNNENKVSKKAYKQLYNADILFSDKFEVKD